jgi:hypothetical protein
LEKRRYLRGASWIGLYLALTHWLVLLVGSTPPIREFWKGFSVALYLADRR